MNIDQLQAELRACSPDPLDPDGFNSSAVLPYGLTTDNVRAALQAFIGFLGAINNVLNSNDIERLETLMMPANFSTLVGEFMASNLPKQCSALAKNLYHNGHPDLIPAGMFEGDAVQYAHEGIEIKASRNRQGWQGHNPEASFLMIFVYDVNRVGDGSIPRPFSFHSVVAAQLVEKDWSFAGRSDTSRRTPTASIIKSGFLKLTANWVYKARLVTPEEAVEPVLDLNP